MSSTWYILEAHVTIFLPKLVEKIDRPGSQIINSAEVVKLGS